MVWVGGFIVLGSAATASSRVPSLECQDASLDLVFFFRYPVPIIAVVSV